MRLSAGMAGLVLACVVLASSSAAALEPRELAGAWTTHWSNNAGEPVDGDGPLSIAVESEDTLDGLQPASGMDGVMNGAVTAGADGALVWEGQWVSIWPEGASRGNFRFVFTDANTFTGVWSSDDGVVKDAVWNGRRVAH